MKIYNIRIVILLLASLLSDNVNAAEKKSKILARINTGINYYYVRDDLYDSLIYTGKRPSYILSLTYLKDAYRFNMSISSPLDVAVKSEQNYKSGFNNYQNNSIEISKQVSDKTLFNTRTSVYSGFSIQYLQNELDFSSDFDYATSWLTSHSGSFAIAVNTRINQQQSIYLLAYTPIISYVSRPDNVVFKANSNLRYKKNWQVVSVNKHRGLKFKTSYLVNVWTHLNLNLDYELQYIASEVKGKIRIFSHNVALGLGYQY